MKHTSIIRKVILAAVIFGLVLSVTGCSRYHSYDDLLGYRHIWTSQGLWGYQRCYDDTDQSVSTTDTVIPQKLRDKIRVFVLTDNQSYKQYGLDGIRAISSLHHNMYNPYANTPDYSESFIIFVTWGINNDSDITAVTDIWQKENTVYLRSVFIPDTLYFFQDDRERLLYSLVQIKTAKLSQHGKINFILLDEYGKEIASTWQTIPDP